MSKQLCQNPTRFDEAWATLKCFYSIGGIDPVGYALSSNAVKRQDI